MTEAAGPDLPPEFDPDYYRGQYPDLAALSDEAARQHFLDWGVTEGRVASPVALREAFLSDVLARVTGPMLEIGPFCRPLVRGDNVRYLDIMDAAALRARAEEVGLDTADCPDEIHYTGNLGEIAERFDAVVSSHSVEHQPDLVQHLKDVADILTPSGRYYLIIPDKRYCFDALIPESTIANVLYAHEQKRTVHTLQSVIEHRAMVTHNDGEMHWSGEHGPFPPEEQARRVRLALAEYEAAAGGYLDVHAWYWTPETFRQTIGVVYHLGLADLLPVRVYQTPRPRFEFCAVLEKTAR